MGCSPTPVTLTVWLPDPASIPVRLKLAVVWPAVMATVVVALPSTMVSDAAVALVSERVPVRV